MVRKFLTGKLLPLLLAAVIPTASVFAQEPSVEPEAEPGMAGVQNQQVTDQEEGRQIQIAESFQQICGNRFSLDAKVSDGSELGLECYHSNNEDVVIMTRDETTGEILAEAVGAGEAVITITLPATDTCAELQAETVVEILPAEAEKTMKSAENLTLEKGLILTIENTAGGVKLTWDKIEGAEGYYLSRRTAGQSSWDKIGEISGNDVTTYTDTGMTPGKVQYYRVQGYADGGETVGEESEAKRNVFLEAPGLQVTLSAKGNLLKWSRITEADGYYVYRRISAGDPWLQVAELTESGEVAWWDTSAVNGRFYWYMVRGYNGESLSLPSPERGYARVSAPSVKKWKRASSTKYKLTWGRNSSADGYQIQYAQNAGFIGAKTKTIGKGSTTSYTVSKLKKKKTYYARIRAYKRINGKTYYSPWSASGNIKSTRTTKVKILTKKKKVFEIRSWAKQKVHQYDTLQGSCSDGTYAYYLLNYKKVSKCKIVKVKRSSLKVVKVSAPLDVAHGNDMTYDPNRRRLVIVHSTGKDPKALTSVNPDTLTVIESKHVKIPRKLAGGSVSDASGATAFSGLAYSSGRREYAVLLSHNYNFVILDSNLDPVNYVPVKKKNNYVVQGIDATDDYILVAQSPKSSKQKYNIITVYDWDGNYIAKINVKKGYEIESIYHVGSKYYAGFYRSYYKTGYKNVIKKVKVKGKVKKKKVKVKYRKYQKDNYVYQITGI